MSTPSLTFVARPPQDIGKLIPRESGDELPPWLGALAVLAGAREVLPTLPDDSEIVVVEAWDEYPAGAVAVVPPGGMGKVRRFAISTAAVDDVNPANFGNV